MNINHMVDQEITKKEFTGTTQQLDQYNTPTLSELIKCDPNQFNPEMIGPSRETSEATPNGHGTTTATMLTMVSLMAITPAAHHTLVEIGIGQNMMLLVKHNLIKGHIM